MMENHMLAIKGGTPVRNVETHPWSSWPLWGQEEQVSLNTVVSSGIWSYNGPKEKECLSWLKDYFSPSIPLLVSNGTVSLQLALEALDIGYGDEVIVPGMTWQATAAAVLDVNAVPILVDVDPETWCIDPKKFEEAITARTKAVMPVHLYGCTADMDEIMRIARKHSLFVVEDASHKHGAQWRNRKIGTIGDIGSFSLQLSKVLTCGEGGILLTADQSLWERLEALRNCGRRSKNDYTDTSGGQYGLEGDLIQSGNYRITEFQAAVLLDQCNRLDTQNARRQENAMYLDSLLLKCPGVKPMRFDARETKKTYFNYTCIYDRHELGIPAEIFREALAAELGFEVAPSYQPLNDCTLYRPNTKKRYRLSDDHWKRIDPSRFTLPVCDEVYQNQSICLHHKMLLGSSTDMDMVAQAIQKIAAHKDELTSK
jgi:L-glutamine:2-deoxy-scyllo-inosose/3-amino-2,3-dideoxy-scyllo-inosose aminotransferase